MSSMIGKPAADLMSLLGVREALHPDLSRHVGKAGVWPALRHPLVYRVPYWDGENPLINRQYAHKREALSKARRDGDWNTVIFLHERPYRAAALAMIAPFIDSDADYWRLVASVWTDTENFWQERGLWLRLLTATKARRATRHLMMTEQERAKYDALPNALTVYRGGSSGTYRFPAASGRRKSAQSGFSWTTDRNVARWFSGRFLRDGEHGLVYERTVARSDVIALLDGRGEHEVLLLPTAKTPPAMLVESIGKEHYRMRYARRA